MTYTREYILNMSAQELAEATAVNVLGWEIITTKEDVSIRRQKHDYTDGKGIIALYGIRYIARSGGRSREWNPAEDISAAWEVVETLQATHIYTDIRTCADFYEVWITTPPFKEEEQKTETVASPKLPAAICKAALLAVMGV